MLAGDDQDANTTPADVNEITKSGWAIFESLQPEDQRLIKEADSKLWRQEKISQYIAAALAPTLAVSCCRGAGLGLLTRRTYARLLQGKKKKDFFDRFNWIGRGYISSWLLVSTCANYFAIANAGLFQPGLISRDRDAVARMKNAFNVTDEDKVPEGHIVNEYRVAWKRAQPLSLKTLWWWWFY